MSHWHSLSLSLEFGRSWLLQSGLSSVAGPGSCYITSHVHSALAQSLPAHPVLPLDIKSSSLVVALVCKAASPKETRAVLSFSGATSLGQRIFYSSLYMSVADNSHTGLGVAKPASCVVLFVLSLCLPKVVTDQCVVSTAIYSYIQLYTVVFFSNACLIINLLAHINLSLKLYGLHWMNR